MIEILVLQNPKVLVNKQEMMFPYKKVEALLYYMAVEKSATRDQIATLLWEDCDESSARKNLRHALYTIRKVFGEELITSPTRQNLELNQELEIESDYDRFLEENEKNGTEVYKSDFLQNFYLKNAGAFEDWMNFKRGKLKEIYLNRLYEKMQNVEHLSLKKREKLLANSSSGCLKRKPAGSEGRTGSFRALYTRMSWRADMAEEMLSRATTT